MRNPAQTFSALTLTLVLLLTFGPVRQASAQSKAPAPADVDSGKVQPLEMKPGCWEVQTQVTTVGLFGSMYRKMLAEHNPQEQEKF